jgi:hypothetical protein
MWWRGGGVVEYNARKERKKSGGAPIMDFVPKDFVEMYRPRAVDPVMEKKLGKVLRDLRSRSQYTSHLHTAQANRAAGRQATRDGNRDKFLTMFRDFCSSKAGAPAGKYGAKLFDALAVFANLAKIIEMYFKTSEDAVALYQMGASYNFTYDGTLVDTSAVISAFRKHRDSVLPALLERYTLEISTKPDDKARLEEMELLARAGST